jgi:uncharacterized protein
MSVEILSRDSAKGRSGWRPWLANRSLPALARYLSSIMPAPPGKPSLGPPVPGPAASAAVVARELGLPVRGVQAVIELAASGATVPFLARYRKEATGGLDEVAIRAILERATYLAELDQRRRAIFQALEAQGQIGADLRAALSAAST